MGIYIVKTAGEWQVTLRENTNIRSIIDNGIEINGGDMPVRSLTRNLIVVSFFGVYMNSELDRSAHGRESATVIFRILRAGSFFCRVELSEGVRSLPYATRIAEVNVQIKHNGQLKVCNYCLSEEHLMRSCPDRRKCYNCNLPGHITRECPDKEEYQTDQTVSDEGDDDEAMSGRGHEWRD